METLQIVCPHCDQINRVPAARLRDGGRCGQCKQSLFTGKPVALDDEARFAKHARASDIPLLVDLWAPWCGPCRAMAPIFEQAAQQIEPLARLVKVNSDVATGIAQRFQVRSIPTLLVLARDREVARQAGAMSLPQLLQWARPHLAAKTAA